MPVNNHKLPYGAGNQQFADSTERQYRGAQKGNQQRVQQGQQKNPSIHGSGIPDTTGWDPAFLQGPGFPGSTPHGGIELGDRSQMDYGTEPALPASDSRMPYRQPGQEFGRKTEKMVRDVRGRKNGGGSRM